MNDNLIKTENLCKSYHTGDLHVEVLKDVDLSVEKGDFIAVMGPSGSGKSTLLHLIGGLDRPSAGKVFLGDRDLSELSDREISVIRRRNIGFVFQFYNLIPNLNVEENILLPVLLDGKSLGVWEERLSAILNTVGLTDRRKHTPNELSGGQQQRVAIARALINEPDLILADEPTGNLDTRSGNEVMTLFQEVNRTYSKTILMVTHSTEAAAYAHRTIHVRDGRIEE